VLRTLERRFPFVRVLLFPVRVQGEGAAAEIARAIRGANAQGAALGGIDVMIVGRGGGSLEDLWAFNEEPVAQAIFESVIPVISAVGHEVDITIADLVADVRAATPTAAAEIAVPLLSDLLDDLATVAFRLHRRLRSAVDLGAARVEGLLARSCFRDAAGIVRRPAQLLDETVSACQLRLHEGIRSAQRRVERGENLVARISPHASLLRGQTALAGGVQRLGRGIERALSARLRATELADHRLARSSPVVRLARSHEKAEAAATLLETAASRRLETLAARLGSTQSLLQAVSHERVLARGFSITRTKKGRRIVRSIGEVADGDRLVTQVADGEFESQALNNQQRELFDTP
jgi:exodeoxyribonuclease VII large subunit